MMRLELRTCWFLDRKLIVLAIRTCYVSLVDSKPSEFRSHHDSAMIRLCAICRSLVLKGISKPQATYWTDFHLIIMWFNHSFHHWCISTKQHVGLLLLFKALNLIPTSSQRNSVLKLRIEKQRRKKGELCHLVTPLSLSPPLPPLYKSPW